MKIVTSFLDRLGILYNEHTVENFFATHPYHPSIGSISDLLDTFKIENAGVAVGKENFSQVPVPFIAKTSSSDGDYCLVTSLENNKITYLNEKNKWVSSELETFFLQYGGAILAADKSGQSGEPDYLENKKKHLQKRSLYIGSLLLFISIFLIALLNHQMVLIIPTILLFVFKLLGISVCTLLLIQSFDANNPFVNKFCSSGSENGCKNILGTSSAKIFGGTVSWSEIGFFYFLSTFITLCLSGGSSTTINFLAFVNILAIPYTVYSIGHQFNAKSWCRLCLTVQVLLWLEFLSSVSCLSTFTGLSPYKVPSLIFVGTGLLCVVLWFTIKPLIKSNQQVAKLERDLNLFKKDDNIFYTLLEQQRKVEQLEEKYRIVFGNPDAGFQITFVSNPFCVPCSEMHKLLQQLLNECRAELAINVVYAGSFKIGDQRNDIIQRLAAIYQQGGSEACEDAMEQWYDYGIKKPQTWIEKYRDYDKYKEGVLPVFEQHRAWCSHNDITHTPALFFNDHLYLSEYKLNDLKHFIHSAAKSKYGTV